MQRVLVAGATGTLGRHVVQALKQQGVWVRALSRSARRAEALGADQVYIGDATRLESIGDSCDGVDAVCSCLGQSVRLTMRNRGPGYRAVDTVGNLNLISTALIAGARRGNPLRFVYVSVFGAEQYPHLAYMRAHADVAAELRRSGLSYAIIQPTGFFSAFDAIFAMARSGRAVVFGNGQARTNPIDDRDLADVCVQALGQHANLDIPAGGPQVYTRRAIVEMAFAALGRPARIRSAPAWLPGLLGRLASPFAPRVGELLDFVGTVSTHDVVAPAYGQRTLAAYFHQLASADTHGRE